MQDNHKAGKTSREKWLVKGDIVRDTTGVYEVIAVTENALGEIFTLERLGGGDVLRMNRADLQWFFSKGNGAS